MHTAFFFVTTFLATGVEVIEMATIVLGVGVTRGWSGTLLGAATSLAVLTGMVAVRGPASTVVPIADLRAAVGLLLLLFGAQGLPKGFCGSAFAALSPGRQIKAARLPMRRQWPGEWTGQVLSWPSKGSFSRVAPAPNRAAEFELQSVSLDARSKTVNAVSLSGAEGVHPSHRFEAIHEPSYRWMANSLIRTILNLCP